jgi:hypothetical protein
MILEWHADFTRSPVPADVAVEPLEMGFSAKALKGLALRLPGLSF